MYTENDLVRVAKRENNTKRNYLLVNPLQGKHIPVKPSLALDLFAELGSSIALSYRNESILFIGFAETATAIGAAIAIQFDGYYMQTTRERIEGVEYFYFSESHSHATEQKLVKDDLDVVIHQVDRVIFVEDEVTTGNTILNIIRLLQAQYGHAIRFSVASLLNGMDEQAWNTYQEQNINLHYLVKTDHSTYGELAETAMEDGSCLDMRKHKVDISCNAIACGGSMNARRLVMGSSYKQACHKLWEQIEKSIGGLSLSDVVQNILVLGTEEFMYPAMYAAQQLESAGNNVFFHATTRSPISVSKAPDYPLHLRFCLPSIYENDRTTYIYNLRQYDQVLIITDAPMDAAGNTAGLQALVQALGEAGNAHVHAVRWC